jgi:hypothetical protein
VVSAYASLAASSAFFGPLCILNHKLDRPGRSLRRFQQGKDVHLGRAECPSDLGNRARPIFDRYCELLGFSHWVL